MTLTINQILVFLLIGVLIAFLVEMGILAKHAIPLMKKSKDLVESSNQAVDDVKSRADHISDSLEGAINSITENANPALKVLGGLAAGLTAVNSISAVGKGLSVKSALLAGIAGSRNAKRAKKEIKRSKKAVKQLKKQTRIENKALKQSAAIEKKAARAELAAAKAGARLEKRMQSKAAKQDKRLAKEAARNDLKAIKYERKLARKLRKAQKKAGTDEIFAAAEEE